LLRWRAVGRGRWRHVDHRRPRRTRDRRALRRDGEAVDDEVVGVAESVAADAHTRAVPIDVEGVVAGGVEELAAVEDLASVDDDPAVAGQDPMFDFDRVTAEILVAEVPAFRCHVARHSTDGPRTLRCRTASRSPSRKYWSISAPRCGLFQRFVAACFSASLRPVSALRRGLGRSWLPGRRGGLRLLRLAV